MAVNSSAWFHWNTPTGLGFFFISVGVTLVLLSAVLMNLARTGNIGLDMAQRGIQLKDSVRMMELGDDDELLFDQQLRPMMPAGQRMMQGY